MYKEYSTRSATRRSRGTGRTHNLTVNTALPAQKVVLNVAYNNKQLIELICNDLLKDTAFQQKYTKQHKLVLTGQEDNPVEISKGIIITRKDLSTSHEEADNIIVQQTIIIARKENTGVFGIV